MKISKKIHIITNYSIKAKNLPKWRLHYWIKSAAELLRIFEHKIYNEIIFNIKITNKNESRYLNRMFRGINKPTNILTFNYKNSFHKKLFIDIAICLPILIIESFNQKKFFLDHAAHIILHGFLHGLGYNHKHGNVNEMRNLEITILKSIGIDNPYKL